jgi:hypothetical protein
MASDVKSILWRRRFAKERRSRVELANCGLIVFFVTSSGGIYGHLHLDFNLAFWSLICNMNVSKTAKFPAAIQRRALHPQLVCVSVIF